jgi:hypothetical protein
MAKELFIVLFPAFGLALFACLACWYNLWRIDQFLKKDEERPAGSAWNSGPGTLI